MLHVLHVWNINRLKNVEQNNNKNHIYKSKQEQQIFMYMPTTLMYLMYYFLRMHLHGKKRLTSSAIDETFRFSRSPRNRRASSLRDARHTKRPISLPMGP